MSSDQLAGLISVLIGVYSWLLGRDLLAQARRHHPAVDPSLARRGKLLVIVGPIIIVSGVVQMISIFGR